MKRDYGDTKMSWRVAATLGADDGRDMGEYYEKVMKNLVDAGLDYIDEHPDKERLLDDEKKDPMYQKMLAAAPDCSFASFDEALGHVWYIKRFGLNKFITELEAGRQAHILRKMS